jgi:hypothetical protein
MEKITRNRQIFCAGARRDFSHLIFFKKAGAFAPG